MQIIHLSLFWLHLDAVFGGSRAALEQLLILVILSLGSFQM